MHKNAFEDVYCKEMELIEKLNTYFMYFYKRSGKGRGTKIKCDKKRRATSEKVMSPGVPRGDGGRTN